MKPFKDFRYWCRRHLTQNPRSRRQFETEAAPLTPAQQRTVEALRKDGIAQTTFAELWPAADRPMWLELDDLLQEFLESNKVRHRIDDYRAGRCDKERKGYLIKHLDSPAPEVTDGPLLRFGLHPAILDVVNSYFGMCVKLNAMNLWYNIPCGEAAERRASQHWHRDPEDRPVVKVFLHLSDVDDESGPFEYIPESRRGGKYESLWRFSMGRRYPPQDLIENTVPLPERRVMTGPRGSVVFCDTSGLHRGGFGKSRERILATWAYVSPASLYERNYRIDRRACVTLPSAKARYAVA
jgi:hypothetical protein